MCEGGGDGEGVPGWEVMGSLYFAEVKDAGLWCRSELVMEGVL